MIGNDLRQIGQPVTIEGKEYNLIIDLNGLVDLEEKYKNVAVEMNEYDIKTLADKDNPSGLEKAWILLLRGDLKTVRFFFWVALRHSDDNITERQSGKILGSSNLHAVQAAIRRAMTASLPETDEKNAVAPMEEK